MTAGDDPSGRAPRRRWWHADRWRRSGDAVGDSAMNLLPEGWERVLTRRWAMWPLFDTDERARLAAWAARFVATKRFEAARGYTVTDEMRVLVAFQAALLLIGMDLDPGGPIDPYGQVRSVIIHRSTVVLRGARTVGSETGTVTSDAPYHISGQAHQRGPVVLVWTTLAYEARHPDRGQNLVVHEFAHQLDMLDGVTDGVPPIADDALRAELDRASARVFAAVRRRPDAVLREYAGTDRVEFFAVASEGFFTRPVALRDTHLDLYRALQGFYGQDPAARVERSAG